MVNSSRHWERGGAAARRPLHGHRARPDRPRRLGDAARRLLARRARREHPRPARRRSASTARRSSATRSAAASRCSSSTSSRSARERLVLVSSGGLGREVSPLLRSAALPGHRRWRGRGRRAPARRRAALGGARGAAGVSQRSRARCARSRAGRARGVPADAARGDRRARAARQRDRPALPARAMPTLIVWGERDNTIPIEHGRAAHERDPRQPLRDAAAGRPLPPPRGSRGPRRGPRATSSRRRQPAHLDDARLARAGRAALAAPAQDGRGRVTDPGRAAAAAHPLRHDQSTGQRARMHRLPGRICSRRQASRRSRRRATPTARTSSHACAGGRRAAAPAPWPRRRRDDRGAALDAPAVRRRDRRRLRLGPRRARHEGRRCHAGRGLPEGEAEGLSPPGDVILACSATRRTAGRRRALPGRGAPGPVPRRPPRARRVRRLHTPPRRQAVLPDHGGREAGLLDEGDRARSGGHGSMPIRGGAMAKAGDAAPRARPTPPPVRITRPPKP